MDSRMPRPRHIVIIGGGVIGATTAYFLTRHPSFDPSIHHITLLEATSIAAAASGKAGGLIGLWAYPTCIVPLSYRLHAELAAEHNGASRWGYRRVGCGQLAATVRAKDLKKPPLDSSPSKSWQEKRGSRSSTSATPTALSPQEGLQPPQPLQHNGQGQEQEQEKSEGQVWQKIPKQDQAAKSLLKESVLPADLDWINADLVREYDDMGLPGYTETAQVHPYQFTTSMVDLAREGGAEIRVNAKVAKIGLNTAGTAVKSIEYLDRTSNEMRTIQGVTDVVVAAGPWTGGLLPSSKIEGLRAHSVIFEADVSPYAVFTNISLPNDWVPAHRAARGQRRKHKGNVDPEVYARPGREVYACGEPDYSVPLPATADLVACDESQCDDLVAYIGTVSPVLGSAPIAAKQACYMPRHMRPGQDSIPIVGATAVTGLWVAAGHTCWGIQNGPGTGKLMSELILDGKATSAEVADLDPRQFGI
ncbi:FAD dependent oxidoreductase [Biscogniauxia mediterranea]|nr:FAD dependent oxidoreductase [Biscogniauxia mediterranea]